MSEDQGRQLGFHPGFRANPGRSRIRRSATALPDGLVILSILLIALILVSLLMAAITAGLIQLLRLAGGDENRLLLFQIVALALGIGLAVPMIVVFAHIVAWLERWVGQQCPGCRQRELEWRSGSWKYGDPPDFLYYSCASCGASFKQLHGGQGVLSDLEPA